ncbi:hypothetical protein PVK06_030637 [Gossypium arboreum]|uniref:Aminotransferase-like plant mobile domain-containing protein n=1 Tax=Gossypium arboreum TaxID=29729 RepID=A0ABR0NNT8_GOSAR|nr:hypothetical protein PVK06_030637 [Gossypium arboreum]
MAEKLIRFDHKNISIEQMKMFPITVDRKLLEGRGFWHVTNIGRGCKLDWKPISAFIERWRPKTHTFHLPCEECTIALEDVQLQLELPVDGSVLTESVQSADWGAICYIFWV